MAFLKVSQLCLNIFLVIFTVLFAEACVGDERVDVLLEGDSGLVIEYDTGYSEQDASELIDGGIEPSECTPSCPDGKVCVRGYCLQDCSGPIKFSSRNLEMCVRKKLRKEYGELTGEDMLYLTSLSCGNQDIDDLSGIECAVNLEVLLLDKNRIKTINELAALDRLRTVDLTWNYIHDINPLKGRRLLSVYLNFNYVEDISALEGYKDLNVIELALNEIKDISLLKDIGKGAEQICLHGNPIGNVEPLSGLRDVQILDVSNCGLDDITPLSNMTNLEILDLTSNEISDISTIRNMSELYQFWFNINPIEDLSDMPRSPNLAILVGANTKVYDISVFEELVGLTVVYFMSANVYSIDRLRRHPKLEVINLRNNNLMDITALVEMPGFLKADFRDNRLDCEANAPIISYFDRLKKKGTPNIELRTDCAGAW